MNSLTTAEELKAIRRDNQKVYLMAIPFMLLGGLGFFGLFENDIQEPFAILSNVVLACSLIAVWAVGVTMVIKRTLKNLRRQTELLSKIDT